MKRPIVIALAVALLAAGIAAAIAGCVPYERMQAAGALVRRTADFTPERFARFRHVCWFFALALPGLSYWCWSAKPPASPKSLAVSQSSVAGDARAGWLLGLIVAAGCALRVQRLFDPVAYDEAYTYLNFASRPWYEAIGDYNSTNNHLLNTLLMHVSTRIFGPQEWAMRWHVLLAGTLLPWAVFVWGRDWMGRGAGWIAAAAVAVSPMLITYSTDARGYMLVVLAAIVFDLSLRRLARDDGRDRTKEVGPTAIAPLPGPPPAKARGEGDGLAWWMAWGALVFGLCSMPLMVYAAIGSAAWFILTPIIARLGAATLWQRVRTVASLGLFAAPAVAMFYAPAYIFRGMMFLSDPIVLAADETGFAASLGSAWWHAFEWWTDGIVPSWLWGILALIGVARMPDGASRLRWLLPFAVVLVLNIVQHVAPPPRIYMHLAPWLFLAAAQGLLSMVQTVRLSTSAAAGMTTTMLLMAGGYHAAPHAVLFHADERADFVSVPDVMDAMAQDRAQHRDQQCVLLAPLPCDLPSLFYLRREGIDVPVNARPQAGERVYLIARPGETPEDVLATPLLQMAAFSPQFAKWEELTTTDTLSLYVSRYGDNAAP